MKGKANLRQLTDVESDQLENIKFAVLCSHDPYSEITPESVEKACANLKDITIEKAIRSTLLSEMEVKYKTKPTMDDKRIAIFGAYSLTKIE
jgi:hypothetical protein